MVTTTMNAVIFYKHSTDEVAALSAAVIPLADNIKGVSSPQARSKMRQILSGQYFRAGEARTMKDMLLRAAKHARANLADYFPLMRADILVNAQTLEQAANAYWRMFCALRNDVIPTR